MLSIHQFEHLSTGDIDATELYTGLKKLIDAVNTSAAQSAVDPTTTLQTPGAITGLSVLGANGMVDIAITDNSTGQRKGLEYFVEYSLRQDFENATVLSLGPSRNYHKFLGNQTLYFRAYSQYIGSQPSTKIPYGNPPIPVALGGTVTPPPQQPSQGSGTGGGGYGTPYRAPSSSGPNRPSGL